MRGYVAPPLEESSAWAGMADSPLPGLLCDDGGQLLFLNGAMLELCDVAGALREKDKAAKQPTMEDIKRVLLQTVFDHPGINPDTEGFGEMA